ncbi:MAG: hypothetical protein GY854_01250 [Deltaproteobacteria bacterium]|nr:hypothetical protein [Deltaproteobacteria bacterium]
MSKSSAIGIVIALSLFTAGVHLRTATASIYNEVTIDDERYFLPPAGWLKVFSLGYNEAVADLVWIKTLVYSGGVMLDRKKRLAAGIKKDFSTNYLYTATDLDPKFRSLYSRGSTLTLFQGLEVTKKSVLMTIDLLERGTREFPADGSIMFDLGFMHFYEMRSFFSKEPNDPETQFHRELGRRLIYQSTLLEGSPQYATLLASTLMKKEGLIELEIEHLKTMLFKETDPSIRNSLEKRLRATLGQAASHHISTSKAYRAEWQEQMSFIPFSLFLVMRSDVSIEETLDPLYRSNRALGIGDDAPLAEETMDAGE